MEIGFDRCRPIIRHQNGSICNSFRFKTFLKKYTYGKIISGCHSEITEESGRSAFHFAANKGDLKIMKMLYETNPKIKPGWVDYTNFTMLMWAVESSNPDMLAFLLSKASSLDLAKTDNESKTALHWAAHFGKHEFCRLILDFDSSYGYKLSFHIAIDLSRKLFVTT